MTRNYLWMLLCATLFLFASCVKAPELTVTSSSSIELSADGSSGSITFTANRAWTASASDSWVSVSPSSGEASDKPMIVTVRCNANTTYDDRTATVTIRMEDLSKTVTIRQPANLGILLSTQAFVLTSEAHTIDVEVQANVQYTVETSVDWIRQSGTKGLTSSKYRFNIAENTTYDDREGIITIKSQNSSVPDQIITVKQAQKDAIIIKDASFNMPYGGGEIEFNVEANVAFDVTTTAGWLHYVGTKGLSSSTVRVTVDENATFDAREGKIDITQQNGALKHTITVNQVGRIAVTSVELDQTELSLGLSATATLTATVKPDNATDKTVTWSSSNTAIATVDNTGKVTAVKEGSTTITAKAGEMSATCLVEVINVPDSAVDLGIVIKREDGSTYRLFWAKCNIGASKPEEYGDYYAWGETETKSEYNESTYKWANGAWYKLTKYCWTDQISFWDGTGSPDEKTVLDPEDDVAHVKLGGKWRMPTDAEWEELRNNCTWTWTAQNGVEGSKVTSKKNGNSIFLPAAGRRSGTSLLFAGSGGEYWSSSLDTDFPCIASGVYFNLLGVLGSGVNRYIGFCVRPVSE